MKDKQIITTLYTTVLHQEYSTNANQSFNLKKKITAGIPTVAGYYHSNCITECSSDESTFCNKQRSVL
jgi:hypothetical protein